MGSFFMSKKDRMQEALAKNLTKQILGASSVSMEIGRYEESFLFDNYQYDFCFDFDKRGLSVFKDGDFLYSFNARVQSGAVLVDKIGYNIFSHILNICRQEWNKSNEKTIKKYNAIKGLEHNKAEIELLKMALAKTK